MKCYKNIPCLYAILTMKSIELVDSIIIALCKRQQGLVPEMV